MLESQFNSQVDDLFRQVGQPPGQFGEVHLGVQDIIQVDGKDLLVLEGIELLTLRLKGSCPVHCLSEPLRKGLLMLAESTFADERLENG